MKIINATKTVSVKLYPTKTEQAFLRHTMQEYKKACNIISDFVFRTHILSSNNIQRYLYSTLRQETTLPSQMICSAIRDVVGKYKSLISNKHRWRKIKFSKNKVSYQWRKDYSLVKGDMSIATVNGRVHIGFAKKYVAPYFDVNTYQFGGATLIERNGKFYMQIAVKYSVPDFDEDNVACIVGLDRGENFLVAGYDSYGNSLFEKGRPVKAKRNKYKKVRESLQKRNTASARRRLKKIGQREHGYVNDVNHCITKALVESYPNNTVFVLEDLKGIRKNTEHKRAKKNRYFCSSWSFYDLDLKLSYKANEHGSKVIHVPAAYTSQRCPCCGYTDKKNRNKRKHLFFCQECCYTSNDDRVAALNLYQEGVKLYPNTVVS